jgi:hypothetical protein
VERGKQEEGGEFFLTLFSKYACIYGKKTAQHVRNASGNIRREPPNLANTCYFQKIVYTSNFSVNLFLIFFSADGFRELQKCSLCKIGGFWNLTFGSGPRLHKSPKSKPENFPHI